MSPLPPAAVSSSTASSSAGVFSRPLLAASLFRPGTGPRTSASLGHLCLLRRVPGSPSLAGHSIEPHLEQSPGVVPRKPSASGGVRCGVKSSSILGHTHSFDGCMFGSVLTRRRGQQSVNNLGEFLCVRRPRLHEGQRNSQRRRHCFKSVVTSFQAGARRLHSRSASRPILSTRIHTFCNLPLVGS